MERQKTSCVSSGGRVVRMRAPCGFSILVTPDSLSRHSDGLPCAEDSAEHRSGRLRNKNEADGTR